MRPPVVLAPLSLWPALVRHQPDLLPRVAVAAAQLRALPRRVRRMVHKQWRGPLLGLALVLTLGQWPGRRARGATSGRWNGRAPRNPAGSQRNLTHIWPRFRTACAYSIDDRLVDELTEEFAELALPRPRLRLGHEYGDQLFFRIDPE